MKIKIKTFVYILFLSFSFIPQKVLSQTILQGHIFERNTTRAIPGIKVSNLNNQETMISDTTGHYQIAAKAGDKVIFEGFAYRTDTLYVNRVEQTAVFLMPKINELAEVKVRSQLPDMSHYGGADPNREKRKSFFGRVLTLKPAWLNPYFKKKRKTMAKMNRYETMEEIDRIFSAFNVGQYLPLKKQELQDFCDLCKPTVEVYRSSRFDFVLYLNDSYKAFMKLPPEKRKLPPLIE